MDSEAYVHASNRIVEITVEGAVRFCTARFGFDRPKGPAVILPDGHLRYCFEGTFHRSKGPAVINPDGDNYYYMFGARVDPTKHFFMQNGIL